MGRDSSSSDDLEKVNEENEAKKLKTDDMVDTMDSDQSEFLEGDEGKGGGCNFRAGSLFVVMRRI